jgi:hypothetical protein
MNILRTEGVEGSGDSFKGIVGRTSAKASPQGREVPECDALCTGEMMQAPSLSR